ncbi:protein of unknown function (plasmid) [Caballeronia sp. S22]
MRRSNRCDVSIRRHHSARTPSSFDRRVETARQYGVLEDAIWAKSAVEPKADLLEHSSKANARLLPLCAARRLRLG